MQDEWQEKFKNKLNDELTLEGVTADNRLIQKTLLAISEAEKPSEAEERREKNGNNPGRTHSRRFGQIFAKTAAAAAVLCVMVFSLLVFRQEEKNKSSDIADLIQNESSSSPDVSPETGKLEDMKEESSIQDGQADAGSEGGSDLLQGEQQATGSGSGLDGMMQESAAKDKLLPGEWDALTVTVPDGRSMKLSAGEIPGSEIISCLQTAVPQTETEKIDWTAMALMYEITVFSEEKNLSLVFYQGGYLLAGEEEEKRSVWKLQEPKMLEELLTNLFWQKEASRTITAK